MKERRSYGFIWVVTCVKTAFYRGLVGLTYMLTSKSSLNSWFSASILQAASPHLVVSGFEVNPLSVSYNHCAWQNKSVSESRRYQFLMSPSVMYALVSQCCFTCQTINVPSQSFICAVSFHDLLHWHVITELFTLLTFLLSEPSCFMCCGFMAILSSVLSLWWVFFFYHYTNTACRKVRSPEWKAVRVLLFWSYGKTGAGRSKTSSSTQEAIAFSVCTEVSVNICLWSNLTSRCTVAGTYRWYTPRCGKNGSFKWSTFALLVFFLPILRFFYISAFFHFLWTHACLLFLFHFFSIFWLCLYRDTWCCRLSISRPFFGRTLCVVCRLIHVHFCL